MLGNVVNKIIGAVLKQKTYMLKNLLIAACVFIGNQLWGQAKQAFAPTGKLVNAGGHLLHIYATGQGGPAVIMENGSGDFSFIWSLVQPSVATFTTAVSYDRAGYAWSEGGPYPRTSRQLALELHTALHNAGIKGPYILVGQSYGGFLVRAFARFYPKEVVGMVLVEALNENARIIIGDKPTRIREFATGRQVPEPQATDKKSVPVAGNDKPVVLDTAIEEPLNKLPADAQKMQLWAQNQPGYRIASDSEMTWSPEDVQDMYVHRGEPAYMLGDIPLIVLTRGSGGYDGRADSAELEDERLQQQGELAKLSTNSKHIIDYNSGHNIHVEDPATVIDAIRRVYDAATLHRKLE